MSAEALKDQIRSAFAAVQYPGDRQLRGSNEGDEPFEVERDFLGRRDWRTLDAEFLDSAPGGLSSALSFFSHEAFRFYLPAYLIADIDGQLQTVNPEFYLTHGLDDESRKRKINPERYGNEVWFEYACERFSAFTSEEAAAIFNYLAFKRESAEFLRKGIDQAIKNYWRHKANLF